MWNPFREAPPRDEPKGGSGVASVRAAYKAPVHDWDAKKRKVMLEVFRMHAERGNREFYLTHEDSTAINLEWLELEGFEVSVRPGRGAIIRWLP